MSIESGYANGSNGIHGGILLIFFLAVSFHAVVSVPEEVSAYTPHTPILIVGNANFTPANGVTGGSGLPSDPYIIEGWDIDAATAHGIEIRDTDAHFVLREVYVHSGGLNYHGILLYQSRNGSVENVTASDNLDGIQLRFCNNVNITANSISNNLEGIYLYSSPNVNITANDVSNNRGDNINLYYSPNVIITANNASSSNDWRGIAIDHSPNVTITANNVSYNHQDGIFLSVSPEAIITANDVSGNWANGILLLSSHNSVITTSRVSSNGGDGISLRFSSHSTTITANSVSSNHIDGISLTSSPDIVVTANNVSNNRYGVFVDNSATAVIVANRLSSNQCGIRIEYSDSAAITANDLSNNTAGVRSFHLDNLTIAGNRVFFSSEIGIVLDRATNATLTANTFLHDGVFLGGSSLAEFNTHTITTDNVVNGAPLYYYKDCPDLTVDGVPVGQLLVVNCTGFVAANLTIADTDTGIEMVFVKDALIASSDISSNDWGGILLGYSSTVAVTANNISSNNFSGFYARYSDNVTLTANNVSSNSWFGIYLDYSPDASVYHNSLVLNLAQAHDSPLPGNSWDDGYPSGGNYWTDYAGTDSFAGPNQDIPGSDGIGDTPYVIDVDSRDRFPLIVPHHLPVNRPPVASFAVIPSMVGIAEEFEVNASASSDLEDSSFSLEVRWDWENDGIWDTPWSTAKTAQHQYSTLGTFTIRLEVRDTGGLVSSATGEVEVIDETPPSIAHTPHGDISVNEAIMLVASVTDDTNVTGVYLNYMAVGALTVTQVRMSRTTGDKYEATIPAQSVPGTVSYYINASDDRGNGARSPLTGVHEFEVVQAGLPPTKSNFPLVAILAVLAVVAVVAALGLFLMRRRRSKDGKPEAERQGTTEETEVER